MNHHKKGRKTMMTHNNLNKWRGGYTIDQTILIVAVIAILVTLIVGSVGWDLLSRTTGTKVASQLKEIEGANSQFYAKYNVWPNEASTGSATANILALVDESALNSDFQDAVSFKNLLPGYRVVGGAVQHSFGAGGDITQSAEEFDSNTYLRIEFANVPAREAREADQTIDGTEGPTAGRLVYGAGSCPAGTGSSGSTGSPSGAATGNVSVCYYANLISS